LNQRAFIVSQILSMGFKSGEYGGKYFGCQWCQLVDLRRCHVFNYGTLFRKSLDFSSIKTKTQRLSGL
jgi:hypothetical protein